MKSRGSEVVAIIVAILLALAAEAAWEYRGERVDEREILAGLRVEFLEARDEIRRDIEVREEILRDSRRFAEARLDGNPLPAGDSLRTMIENLLDWRFYTPTHPVLDEIVSSGRMDRIRSDDVRRALMTYIQERDRIAVIDEQERDYAQGSLTDYLAGRVDLGVLFADGADAPRVAGELDRFRAMLSDPEFGSILYYRIFHTENAVGFSDIVDAAIGNVLATLEFDGG
ncbi:MAG: hypothetical protein ABFS34_05115 [Gemmatimonadota bacterium]